MRGLIMAAQQQARVVAHPEFIILVNTELGGVTSSNQFQLTEATGTYIAEWDGQQQEVSNDYIFEFSQPGIHEIKIYSGLKGFSFNAVTSDLLKLLEVKNWGINEWENTFGMFGGCTNLIITADDIITFAPNVDLDRMFVTTTFQDIPNIDKWDVSQVAKLGAGFNGIFRASQFNQDISNWKISPDVIAGSVFFQASKYNQDLGSLELPVTSNLINMQRFFAFSGMSVENYSRTLIGWANQVYANSGLPRVDFSLQTSNYNDINYTQGEQFNNAVDARNYLINTANWLISGDAEV